VTTSPEGEVRRYGLTDKRWAQRAVGLQFQELESVRAAAQQWRTGLTGLTALLSVTSIVVAPTLTARLQGLPQLTAGCLALMSLLALLYGSWQAMKAAFGVPGESVRATGKRLRRWESDQARAGAESLRRARAATLAGLAFVIATTAVVFVATRTAPGPFVVLETTSGVFCGSLARGDQKEVRVIAPDGTVRAAPLAEVRTLTPVSTC
jgi:multisubunit Na+/H+ antiporter MnhF subunit